MRIIRQKNDNLINLVDGLSLLDEQDQEKIINMVDTLDVTDKKLKGDIFGNVSSFNEDFTPAYTDVKI